MAVLHTPHVSFAHRAAGILLKPRGDAVRMKDMSARQRANIHRTARRRVSLLLGCAVAIEEALPRDKRIFFVLVVVLDGMILSPRGCNCSAFSGRSNEEVFETQRAIGRHLSLRGKQPLRHRRDDKRGKRIRHFLSRTNIPKTAREALPAVGRARHVTPCCLLQRQVRFVVVPFVVVVVALVAATCTGCCRIVMSGRSGGARVVRVVVVVGLLSSLRMRGRHHRGPHQALLRSPRQSTSVAVVLLLRLTMMMMVGWFLL